MKFRSTSSLLLSGALALSLAACGSRHETEAGAEPTVVRAQFARAEKLVSPQEFELAGTFEAERSVSIASRVVALVTAVHVRVGDTVEPGQLLVSIDPTAAEGQADQAKGALAQAEASLSLARRNHERFSALAATQAASELELDVARMQLEQAQGAVTQAQGAVAAARSVARESRVVAPFGGRVTARLVEAGDLAAPGRPLLQLESTGGRRLALELPERLAALAGLQQGSTVSLAIDTRPDLGRFAGKVIEAAPGPDPVTHTQRIKVEVGAGEGPDIASGASGRAWIQGGERTVVVIPAGALISTGGLDLVVVRDDSGRAATRVVTRGRATVDGRIEILSGLAGGETIAVGLASAPAAGAPLEESES